MKQVTRTWTNSKGEVITKTYNYNVNYNTAQPASSWTFKSGKVKKGAVKEIIRSHGEKVDTRSVYQVTKHVEQLTSKIKDITGDKDTLTAQRVWSSYANDKIGGYLSNTGFTQAELAEQLNITVDQLMDARRWTTEGYFFHPNGRVYAVNYTYQAQSTFEDVTDKVGLGEL